MQKIESTDQSAINEELDLREIFGVFKKYFLAQVLIITIFILASIFIAITAPEKWSSSAIIVPVSSSQNIGQISSSQSGLAAMAGINFSQDAPDTSIIISKIKSRVFFEHLISFEGVLKNIIAFESFDKVSMESKYSNDFDMNTKKWRNSPSPSFLQAHTKFLSMFSATSPPRSGMIYLNISHGSPIFAKEFLDIIIGEYNSVSRQKDIEQSQDALEYLYNQLDTVRDSSVQLSISQLIESELKKLTFANVRKNYAIDAIDKPFIPDLRSSPQRTRIVLIGALTGFLISIIGILGYYFFRKVIK